MTVWDWLALVAVLGFGMIAMVVGLLLYAIRRLHLHSRVVPSVRSSAPLHWLVSPRRAARLHRRLRASVQAAHLAQRHRETIGLGLDDVVVELSNRAVDLDRQLVVCNRAPAAPRSRMLRELTAEVRELESIAERTVRLGRAWAGDRPSERGLGPVRDRLDALEAAVRELDGIEQLPVADPADRQRQRPAGP